MILIERSNHLHGYVVCAYKEHAARSGPVRKTYIMEVYIKTWKREEPLIQVNYVRKNINLEDLYTATQMIMDDVKHGDERT